jgi:hypothetical protein
LPWRRRSWRDVLGALTGTELFCFGWRWWRFPWESQESQYQHADVSKRRQDLPIIWTHPNCFRQVHKRQSCTSDWVCSQKMTVDQNNTQHPKQVSNHILFVVIFLANIRGFTRHRSSPGWIFIHRHLGMSWN